MILGLSSEHCMFSFNCESSLIIKEHFVIMKALCVISVENNCSLQDEMKWASLPDISGLPHFTVRVVPMSHENVGSHCRVLCWTNILHVLGTTFCMHICRNTSRWLVNTMQLYGLVKTSHFGYFPARVCALKESEHRTLSLKKIVWNASVYVQC